MSKTSDKDYIDSVPMEDVIKYPVSVSIFEDDDKEYPEYDYLRSLLYDAEGWKKKGLPEFENRVLKVAREYLDEYMANK